MTVSDSIKAIQTIIKAAYSEPSWLPRGGRIRFDATLADDHGAVVIRALLVGTEFARYMTAEERIDGRSLLAAQRAPPRRYGRHGCARCG
jgi:hypothetical protein